VPFENTGFMDITFNILKTVEESRIGNVGKVCALHKAHNFKPCFKTSVKDKS
jgi:hypothetical protein